MIVASMIEAVIRARLAPALRSAAPLIGASLRVSAAAIAFPSSRRLLARVRSMTAERGSHGEANPSISDGNRIGDVRLDK